MTLGTVTIVSVLPCAVVAFCLARRTTAWTWHDRVLSFFVLSLLPICLLQTAARVLDADFYIWNEVRLARTFGLYAGIPLYPGQYATGPILGTLHTPLSHLLYWPATLAPSPVAAVRAGVLLSVVVLLLGVAYAHWRLLQRQETKLLSASARVPRILPFLLSIELFWLCMLNSTLSSILVIHADPVAVACAMVAGGLLCVRPLPTRALVLSALFAVLAVAAKQTFVSLPVALCAFVFVAEGGRAFLRYCIGLTAWTAMTGAIIVGLFRPAKDLGFNLFTLASHRPAQPVVSTFPHLRDGLWLFCIHLERLVGYGFRDGSNGRPFLAFLLLFCVWTWLSLQRAAVTASSSPRHILSHHRWLVFVVIAFGLFPLLFKASITVGGDENHLAIADFFLFLGVTTGFVQYAQTRRSSGLKTAPYLFFFVLVLVFSLRAVHRLLQPRVSTTSLTTEAADFSRHHPGTAYFPSNPLSSVYAVHRFYTFDHAIEDREIAGYPVAPAQFATGLPPGVQLIAVEPRDLEIGEVSHSLLGYLAKGWVRTDDKQLPSFTVYRRTAIPAEVPQLGTTGSVISK